MLPRVSYSEVIISIILTLACKSADNRKPATVDLLTSLAKTIRKNLLITQKQIDQYTYSNFNLWREPQCILR